MATKKKAIKRRVQSAKHKVQSHVQNTERNVQNAERKVESANRKLENATIDAQIAALEEQIALLKEEKQDQSSKFKVQSNVANQNHFEQNYFAGGNNTALEKKFTKKLKQGEICCV